MANILLFYIKTTIKIEESKFYVTFIKIPPPEMQTTLCKYYKKISESIPAFGDEIHYALIAVLTCAGSTGCSLWRE